MVVDNYRYAIDACIHTTRVVGIATDNKIVRIKCLGVFRFEHDIGSEMLKPLALGKRFQIVLLRKFLEQ